MNSCVLAEVWRGGQIESIHTGAYVVLDSHGRVVLSGGDIDRLVFPRSAIKIMQALPLLLDGVADGIGLDSRELALACASHAGWPVHTETASAMLRKAGIAASALQCGTHWPSEPLAARGLASMGLEPTALHNNCSGKHAGFLCSAMFNRIEPDGYVDVDHPVMRRVQDCVEQVLAIDLAKAEYGIDGCSIPTYAVPLSALAGGFARLASGEGLPRGFAEAAATLRRAVATHPIMVAGPGQFDTRVAEHFGEAVFVKSGAEGVCCGFIAKSSLGFAIKCDDGAIRGAELAAAGLLKRLLGESRFLDELSCRPLHNWSGTLVGSVTAAIGKPDRVTLGL